MAIFRGVGGSGDSSDNSFLQEVTAQANAASASATAAANSATSALNTELTSASFNTSDGVLTLTKQDGDTVTADLDGRFLTSYTETDPVFTAHVASGITATNISNWNTAYNNHITAVDYSGSTLTLTQQDGGTLTTTINGALGSTLSHNGSTKIEAISSGVTVTGDITVSGTVDGRDLATDGTKLDGIEANATADQTDAEIKTAYENNADTNAFTDAEKTKLTGIEANATADQTGSEIKSAYESVADTNAFTDAEKTKLSGIEASADVTDTVNVTAAGALMDSEVTNLAQVKAFDSSDYATAAQGSTADSALQNLVEDTTPQLGGDLNAETNDIINVGNISGAQLTIGTAGFSTLSDINLNSQDITSVGNISATGNIITGGNITVGGTVDGVDIAGLETTVTGKADLSGATFTGDISAPNVDISKTGSVTTNISTGLLSSSSSDIKTINIGTGFHNGGTTTINIAPTSTTTVKNINLNGNVTVSSNSTLEADNIEADTIDLSSQLDAVVTSPAQNTPVLNLQKYSATATGTGRFITFSARSSSGGANTLRGMIGLSHTSSPQFSSPFMSHASGSNGIMCNYSGSSSFNSIVPCSSTGSASNGSLHLGHAYAKWNTVYAATGSINTSDITKKQDIEQLSEAESRVAVAVKGLLRKYRWKDSVAEKGDNARIHFGIMAQDLKAAFEAEGLDANRYGMFCADTRWTTDGTDTYVTEEEALEAVAEEEETPEAITEETVYGVRYEELLAFIIAAI